MVEISFQILPLFFQGTYRLCLAVGFLFFDTSK
jgi:hypothetical protein